MAMRLNENLDDNGEMHEINVTPFIDVMLVLLIIFMVCRTAGDGGREGESACVLQPAAAASGKTYLPVREGR